MLNNEIIKVNIWDKETEEFVDITDGILSISTQSGVDYFQGFWDVIDPGQFTIVSRNEQLDPYINELIRQNTLVHITAEKPNPDNPYNPILVKTIFAGFITDFNIEYRKDDLPLITINGCDLFGIYNRTIITDDILNNSILPDYPDAVVPISYLIDSGLWFDPANETLSNFFASAYLPRSETGLQVGFAFKSVPPITPKVKVEVGKNLLELINEGVSTGLLQFDSAGGFGFYFYPYFKYDPTYFSSGLIGYNANAGYWIFKSENADPENDELSYKFITINDGFDRMVNIVAVSNTDPESGNSETFDPASDQTQVINWGPANISASTTFNPTTNSMWLTNGSISNQVATYQSDILEFQAVPKINISSITVDMIRQYWSDPYAFLSNSYLPDNGAVFNINHKINESTSIIGDYVVCGVKHEITVDSWNAQFILRESEAELMLNKRAKTPEIELNLPQNEFGQYLTNTGDSITASISNYSSEDWANVAKVEWFLNVVQGLDAPNPPSHYKALAQDADPNNFWNIYYDLFLDAPIFTGQTVTWNYDDNGPLAGYATNPIWSAFVGPGTYSVYAWVTNNDGYISITETPVEVIVAASTATANFTFSKDQYERVSFVDASAPDTNTWSWNFGDGTTYSGKTPPIKEYSAPGTYNVTLTVNNGYDTDFITKSITIVESAIPVQFIRLRFQGSVTKPAGATDYTTDLIDTIGGLRIRNTSNVETGGNNPFYIIPRTLDKVEIIGQQRSTQPAPAPIFTTNYNSGGPLDPMSQTAWAGWSTNPANLGGGVMPKYKFHPVITNNPDGSQTKTYDFDLIFWYSQNYGNTSVPYYTWSNFNGGTYTNRGPYYLGGNTGSLNYWPQWGPGGTSSYDQRFKISQIWPYAAVLLDDIYGKQGTPSDGRTFLPITISVSADGITYKKVANATFTGAGQANVSYVGTMPPKTTLPTES